MAQISRTSWSTESDNCQTTVTALDWTDEIGMQWQRRWWSVGIDAWRLVCGQALRGVTRFAWRRSRGMWFCHWFAPLYVVMMSLFLVLAVQIVGWLMWLAVAGLTLPVWLICTASLFMLAAFVMRQQQSRLSVMWMLRALTWRSHTADNGWSPILEQCLANWSQDLIEAVRDDAYDEVVIVAHSYGTCLLPSILARMAKVWASQDNQLDLMHINPSNNVNDLAHRGLQKISVMTLGQCIPELATDVRASWYRQELQVAAKVPWNWVDFSASADGVCYPLQDPLDVLKDREQYACRPVVLSPRFHHGMDDHDYRQVRRDKFAYHFLYLQTGGPKAALAYVETITSSSPFFAAATTRGEVR